MNVHVRGVYAAVGTDRTTLERQCDALMEALLAAEEADPAVRDPAVGLDLGKGVIEVEVLAEGDDFDAAAELARARIDEAVRQVTGSEPITPTERHLELVPA